MSSATSTEDQGLRPWQFFLMAGMLSATGVVLVAAGQSAASIVVLSLTVVAASFVALGAYRALAPLVLPAPPAPPLVVGRTRAALEREKTLALRAIKELEFDFAMGKMAKADFDELSTKLRARAINLIKQLDESESYRGLIERELQERLSAQPRAVDFSAPPAGADAGQCHCGTSNDPDARFCKSCGTRLAA